MTDALTLQDIITSLSTKSSKKVEDKVYPPENEVPLDDLTEGDMMVLIYSEIQRKGISGHHLDSINSFYKIGIKQIATNVFVVEGRLKNQRDKTDEDREINEILFKVQFTDINLTSPVTVAYKTGQPQILTPNMARLQNLTYSAQIYIDASITATAVFKNGTTKTRDAKITNHRIASIPCVVGSELCNTFNCSTETLKSLEEDPRGTKGSFIISGNEWVISNGENTTYNYFHVHNNMYMNEISRGTFLSKPGDAFENSYQIIIRYLNSGAITVELTTNKNDKLEIPYYLLFRILGMTKDRDIVNHIVYGIDNENQITRSIMEILEKAFDAHDEKFGFIKRNTNPTEILQFIAQKITEANVTVARKDSEAAKYLNTNVLGTIDRFVFPHIGSKPEHRIKKLRFLGHLINKLLCVNIGVLEPTDRDSYKNKRIFSAGTSIAKTFKTAFNFAIVQEIKRRFLRDFKFTPFSQVQLAESIKAAINSDDLERMITQSITSGSDTITMKRAEVTKRLMAHALNLKNDLNAKSILNTINTPNTSASKQNERADEMRRVHPTYLGYIDVSQSVDTGEKVGMTKQMACTASISGATSSHILKRILLEDSNIIALDDIPPEQISVDKLSKVFVNGDWIGCCKESHEIARKYRTKRRYNDIHHTTTIVWELLIRELYFWTDVGRMLRPLVIVYNNIVEYNAAIIIKKPIQFRQWIKLTKKHIFKLQSNEITMDTLREERVIEYISPEEQENTFIAPNFHEFKKSANDIKHMYTHCDTSQSMFGIVTLAAPLANHSNPTRNTMYTNHRKQSAGWFALNYPYRCDKQTTFQHYCEKPLVSVFSDALTNPNGQNTIVALMLYTGKNQEDSIEVNQSSVDCGMFNAARYNYEKTELEKGEEFGNNDYANTLDIKRDASYEHIQNGFIAKGTIAHKGDILIVKTAKIPNPIDNYKFVDKSVMYNKDEPVCVERIITARNDDGVLHAKVKLRSNRPLIIGDKLSSRTGNKGIVAAKTPRCDFPYCEDGLVPDLIVNSHSIPTRMAVNQIIECVLGQIAAVKGTHIDATAFRHHDIDKAIEILKESGIEYGGHRRMYNGMTGEWMDTLIFIGPTTYQRLQKYIIDEHYATRAGPTSALTRQPLDGKSSDGGLKVGEMEKDVLAGAGTMRLMHEKLYNDSDGIDIFICRVCGNRAIVNEQLGVYKCKICRDSADIATVKSSWVANLFFNELSAMNVNMTFELNPHSFTKK